MNKVRVSGEVWRGVKWLLLGALVAQLVIVPWVSRTSLGEGDAKVTVEEVYYGSIFVRPRVSIAATELQTLQIWKIAYGRLILHLFVTAVLLILWLGLTKAEEGEPRTRLRLERETDSPDEPSGEPPSSGWRRQ